MRAALVLLLLVGCAKQSSKSAEPGPRETAVGGAPAGGGAASDTTSTSTNETAALPKSPTVEAPPPPPPNEGAKGGGAKDQARSSGVLGPTEQQAFVSKGKVTIGTKTTRAVADVVKPALDKLQTCYDKALEYQDTLAGELTITVKAGKPVVAATTLKHAELEQCVVTALAGLTLPKGKATLVLAFARE
jgi:hypothetical protein